MAVRGLHTLAYATCWRVAIVPDPAFAVRVEYICDEVCASLVEEHGYQSIGSQYDAVDRELALLGGVKVVLAWR